MSRPTSITLNPDALLNNFSLIRHSIPEHIRIMAAVKANGYGHESVWVAQVLMAAGVDALAVCSVNEAIELRSYGCPDIPIVLLEGCFETQEWAQAATHNFTIVIHNLTQLNYLKNNKLESKLNVLLKIDTGMGRLGFLPAEIPNVVTTLETIEQVELVLVLSHFANADMPEHPLNAQQINTFAEVCETLPYPKSMANSAAIFSQAPVHYDWVRPGIALYGASPLASVSVKSLGLQAVMTFNAEVIGLKSHAAGDYIGYGSTFRCTDETRIAVVSVGYGDGYPRHAKNGTPVWVNGQRAALAGRVSMDMITVDVTGNDVNIGDKAELWGENVAVDEVAACADTIAYTLFCGITDRVERLEKGEYSG